MKPFILGNSLLQFGSKAVEPAWMPFAHYPRFSSVSEGQWLHPGVTIVDEKLAAAVTKPSEIDLSKDHLLIPPPELTTSIIPVRLRIPAAKWDVHGIGVISMGELQHVILNAAPRVGQASLWSLGEEGVILSDGERPKRVVDACSRERIVSEATSLSLKISTRPSGAIRDSRANAGNVAVFRMFFTSLIEAIASTAKDAKAPSSTRIIIALAPVELLYWGLTLSAILDEVNKKHSFGSLIGFGSLVQDHAMFKSETFKDMANSVNQLTKGQIALGSAYKADEIDSYLGVTG